MKIVKDFSHLVKHIHHEPIDMRYVVVRPENHEEKTWLLERDIPLERKVFGSSVRGNGYYIPCTDPYDYYTVNPIFSEAVQRFALPVNRDYWDIPVR